MKTFKYLLVLVFLTFNSCVNDIDFDPDDYPTGSCLYVKMRGEIEHPVEGANVQLTVRYNGVLRTFSETSDKNGKVCFTFHGIIDNVSCFKDGYAPYHGSNGFIILLTPL